MKLQYKIFAGGMAFFILLGGILSVSAATSVVNGSSYQTVRHSNIPSFGGIHYQTTYGTKKTDSGTWATFKATYTEALLGNYAALINSAKEEKTGYTSLKSTAVLEKQYNTKKGNVYFSAVRSSKYEPSSSCDVVIKFSANNLK